MKYVTLFAVAAVALSMPTMLAHAQTPGAAQQMQDKAHLQDADRMASDFEEKPAKDHRGRSLNPGQVTALAKKAVTAAGLTCDVSQSALIGLTHENGELLEVACKGSTGYILSNDKTPQIFECPALAAQAEKVKSEGGKSPPNSTCRLKNNRTAG